MKRGGGEEAMLSNIRLSYLNLLGAAIGDVPLNTKLLHALTEQEWHAVIETARLHGQMAMIYDSLARVREDYGEGCPLTEGMLKYVSNSACRYVIADHRLWYETAVISKALNDAGIRAVVIKGPSIAKYYDTPECRKSGDVDIWLPDVDMTGNATDDSFGEVYTRARHIVEGFGYTKDEIQGNMHHVAFSREVTDPDTKKPFTLEVELHGRLTEAFEDEAMNRRLLKFQKEAAGSLTELTFFTGDKFLTLSEADGAFYMLLHMLMHFKTRGFGWKFICDWVRFLKSDPDEAVKERLRALIAENGVATFVETITILGVRYLGLENRRAAFLIDDRVGEDTLNAMTDEIFESGEFGYLSVNRMVLPKSASPVGLFKEFHHQMKHNHPEASRHIILWPYLWIVTLVVFIRNNRKLRGVKTGDVIKNAKERSRFLSALKLFEE